MLHAHFGPLHWLIRRLNWSRLIVVLYSFGKLFHICGPSILKLFFLYLTVSYLSTFSVFCDLKSEVCDSFNLKTSFIYLGLTEFVAL